MYTVYCTPHTEFFSRRIEKKKKKFNSFKMQFTTRNLQKAT